MLLFTSSQRTKHPRCAPKLFPMLVWALTGSTLVWVWLWYHLYCPARPQKMGLPPPLTKPVGRIPSDGWCINFSKAEKSCLLTLQSPHDLSSCFWPHSQDIGNHFPIGHPSFYYSRTSTLNLGVLNGCVTKKVNALWWHRLPNQFS